jgi:hypothetical protein
MKSRLHHYSVYCAVLLVLLYVEIIPRDYFLAFLFAGIVGNPDLYEFDHNLHRHIITHSAIIPIVWYYCWDAVYISPEQAKLFIILLFLPFLIHLICDLGGVRGYGLIAIGYYFVIDSNEHDIDRKIKKLSVKQSYFWLLSNIVVMALVFIAWIR